MLQDWLPTSLKEAALRGWDSLDIILFSGDAYVDHPSFGAAVIGRVLENAGYRVAIVPQPNWRDDLRDFKKLGAPRLFFGVSPGAMDSMVNHYTAARRRRSDDAYTADGRFGMRPDMPSIVYSNILKQLWPNVPVVLGGIEASLRRLAHYDYWEDRLRPGLLAESAADVISYGMGEKCILEIARRLDDGFGVESLVDILQTVVRRPLSEIPSDPDGVHDVVLYSYEECLNDKRKQAANFRHIEEESNKWHAARIWQKTGDVAMLVNAPYPPMTTEEIDASFDLPYTRMPHPRYNGKRIPAYEMIRHSVCLHRGCFGGCAFCTISAHQGKFIASRSKESIMREVNSVTKMPDFKGYISDLGGPSANMYRMGGKNQTLCEKCKKPSCVSPSICPNLDVDHRPLLEIYREVDALPEVKKAFVGSGVRYDLILHQGKDGACLKDNYRYAYQLITRHVSGRLKVAPEHTDDEVLSIMRKPSFELFHQFKKIFDEINDKAGLRQQLIPYFISSHPGCTEMHMAALSAETKAMDFQLEQVQDFTPTPMTVSTEIYYTGIHPYTMEPIYTSKAPEEKQRQREYFFWYRPEIAQKLKRELINKGHRELADKLFGRNNYSRNVVAKPTHYNSSTQINPHLSAKHRSRHKR